MRIMLLMLLITVKIYFFSIPKFYISSCLSFCILYNLLFNELRDNIDIIRTMDDYVVIGTFIAILCPWIYLEQ